MTPRQARAARVMLGLDMKTVCALAGVGKRTLTEFEAGNRSIYGATESKIKAFYISKGLSFSNLEDGESVGFAAVHAETAESREVRPKAEYVDLLAVREVLDKISSISELQKELVARQGISQLIILDVLKRLNLQQKALAPLLDCTPSFINAVAVGKKTLPVSRAASLQIFFATQNFDVEAALRQEKLIGKLSAQLLSLSEELKAAWLEILP